MRYMDLDCGWLAKEHNWRANEGDLWALAITVINKIMQDEQWINGYNEPQEKKSMLQRLVDHLQHAQELNRNR